MLHHLEHFYTKVSTFPLLKYLLSRYAKLNTPTFTYVVTKMKYSWFVLLYPPLLNTFYRFNQLAIPVWLVSMWLTCVRVRHRVSMTLNFSNCKIERKHSNITFINLTVAKLSTWKCSELRTSFSNKHSSSYVTAMNSSACMHWILAILKFKEYENLSILIGEFLMNM